MPRRHEGTKPHQVSKYNCLHLCAPSSLCAFVAFFNTLLERDVGGKIMNRSFIAFIVLAQLAVTIAGGQRSTPRSSIRRENPVTGLSRQSDAGARRTGSIAGRVITDSG